MIENEILSDSYEERDHLILNNILDVVGELDLNGIFTYVNPYIYDELGYQPDKLIGREIYDIIHPADIKKITKVLLRTTKSQSFIPEIRLKNDNNQFDWYEIKARRIEDYNRQRKILITLKNISKFKALEEKLRKREEKYQKITNSIPEIQFWKVLTPSKYKGAIHTTSEMLKVIIENIPQCVFWKDSNFKYLGCNRNYSEFIGIRHPESIIGKTDEDLLSNREKIRQIRECETKIMQSGKPKYHTNESWVLNNGEEIWLDINRIPLFDSDDAVIGILTTFEEITDHKITEEKLQKSEEKYKNLSNELEVIMDIIPGMIFIKDKDGEYIRVNQIFADYLNLNKEEIVGKSLFDLFPQDQATALRRHELDILNSGKPKFNIEETADFPSGKISTITSKVPYYNKNEEIDGIIGLAVDITERKINEQKLRESEDKYKNLFEQCPLAMLLINFDGTIEDCNTPLETLFGYNKQEILGHHFLKLNVFHSDSIPLLTKEFKEYLITGVPEPSEIRAYKKDGKIVWISSYPIAIKIAGISYILVMIQDITERKKTKQKLIESEKKYRALSNELETILDLIPSIIAYKDTKNNFIRVNKYLADAHNMTKEDMEGKSCFDLYPPENAQKYWDDDLEIIKSGKPKLNIEEPWESEEGTRWVSTSKIPYIDENGEAKGILGIAIDITEKKLAEEEIRKVHERFSGLYNASKDAIGFASLDGILLDVNDSFSKLTGYSKKELLTGKKNQDITPKEYEEYENKIIEMIIRTGNPEEYEKEYIRKDGSRVPILLTTFIVKGAEGETIGLAAIIKDITERKKAEQKLKESEEKYRSLVEDAQEGVWAVDENNDTIFINPKICKMLGYTKDEMMGKKLDLFLEDSVIELINSYQKRREKGLKDTYEHTFIKKDGTLIYTNVKAAPILEENGVFKGSFAYITDITNRKIAEKKLKESEEKYRNLVETSSMGLLELDIRKGGVVYINPRLLEIVGYTQKELLSKEMFYKAIYPEDYKKVTKSDEEKDIEFRIISTEGKIKWLSGRTLHHYNEQGKLVYLRLWLQDITERKELEEIKSNLLTRISHEFKTPLISIKGFTDLMLSEYAENLDDKIISFLERIKDGGNRLESLINTFLESTQLDKEYVELNLNQENLSMLIRSSLEQMEGVINMREHTVDLNILDDLTTIFDKERIESVFTNLLINAIYYTPKGGNISIQSNIKGKSIIISVKDNGIGLTKEEISKLFEPFGKIERFGKRWDIISEGMGMGLYISKEIIDLHGGKIWAESDGIDKGSKFCFSLLIVKN